MPPSPIEELIESLRSALNAKRRDAAERVERIKGLADAYLDAVEAEIARHFADSHNHARPRQPVRSAEALARALEASVRGLPELAGPQAGAAPSSEPEASSRPPDEREAPSPQTRLALPSGLSLIERAAGERPLVIVGGVAKPDKVAGLPAGVRASLEWIDTTRQGTHAIGNLEQRIRDRRVSALVVLEGLVSHRHSEPLISAARKAGLPFAFGGKGGRAALVRALAELEASLSRER